MTRTIRTRFAPSPTGFIHAGNVRSALYPWAFARSQGGQFVLRIEDTDIDRSSQEAVEVILESLRWLNLTPDEGPFYQTERLAKYQATIEKLKEAGWVYPCYMQQDELDALRERQLANKQKPRYDGTWRPEAGKILPPIPPGVKPVWRFKTPQDGAVAWNDWVKGPIAVQNQELDDLVIARPDGTPTYNFCVVIDDIDMAISHVIRGDDHINNTPRQLHIFKALGAEPPAYAHLPTVLNMQGEKLSKRGGAKSMLDYRAEGFLPNAMVNYLARLGFSHGNDEIFSPEQFVEWFSLERLGKSASQFDEIKLRWVNTQHLKQTDSAELASLVTPFLKQLGIEPDERLESLCTLYKDRSETLVALAQNLQAFYITPSVPQEELAAHMTNTVQTALAELRSGLESCAWNAAAINDVIRQVIKKHNLKMPALAIPVRLLVMGQAQSPSLDAVLALHLRESVLQRLAVVANYNPALPCQQE